MSEPQDPGGGESHGGGEEEAISSLGHGGPKSLLVLHLVTLRLGLRDQRVLCPDAEW
jgi:hypothetical protein